MSRAYIGLGANMEAPAQQIVQAMQALDGRPGTRVSARSPLYRTPPWGVLDQPSFINAVVRVETDLSAHALLDWLMALERAAGRVRDGRRWGPRQLDLDLLLYGAQACADETLEIPHPRMGQRAFVLLPLADIAPELEIPGQGLVSALLQDADRAGCVRLDVGQELARG